MELRVMVNVEKVFAVVVGITCCLILLRVGVPELEAHSLLVTVLASHLASLLYSSLSA